MLVLNQLYTLSFTKALDGIVSQIVDCLGPFELPCFEATLKPLLVKAERNEPSLLFSNPSHPYVSTYL